MPTLDWLHKQQAIKAAGRVPYRLLAAESVHGDPAADNWLIQGDNLDALKALLPFYAGRVKCIYIDPPYNTRSAFEHYDDNLEHSQWLSMMYPRLELLRELLAEEGSIWVSIDDNEAHYLKVVMDEVLGRGNFVTTVIWRKNYSPKSTARHFSEDHDYIVVYAKNADKWVPNLMPRTEKQDKAYRNLDNDPRGPWKPGDLSARNFYSQGTYPITTPSGRLIAGPPNAMYWRVSREKLNELDADGRIWWGKDGSNVPAIKRFLSEVKQGMVPQTWWSYEEVGHTQDAKREVVALFGDEAFGTPKPEQLIQRITHIATNPGDLVLDSFLGSGTTAAVAHKMGRRWIGIEMGEHARTHCLPRLEKVVAGEQGGISQAVGWAGGGGFRFFTLGQPVFLADGGIDPEIRFDTLAAWVWYQETRTPWQPSPPAPAPRPTAGFAQPAGFGGAKHASRNPAFAPQAGEGSVLPRPAGRERTGDRGAMPGTPVLGVREGIAYALLYNGILGDRRPQGGNVLTAAVLEALKALLPEHAGPWVVFGESCRLSPRRLAAENVRFKQIPYEIKAR